jgi:hypothetical protein
MNPFMLQILARLRSPQHSLASDMPYDWLNDSKRIPGRLGDARALDSASFDQAPPPPPESDIPDFDMEAARRDARRQGLGALGIALLKGAPTGDFAGSLAEGFAGAMETRHRLLQEAEQRGRLTRQERLSRDAYDRQNRLTDAQIRNYEDDNERARQALEAKTQGERDEITKQQQVVAGLPPEQRSRLAPLIGTDAFYRDYWEATKPAEPEKPYRTQVGRNLVEIGADGKPQVLYTAPADPSGSGGEKVPTTRQFADGTTRQWNPESHSWDVMAKAAPTDEQTHDDIAAEANQRYKEWRATRMEGVGELPKAAEVIAWQKTHGPHTFPPPKVAPEQHKLRVKMRDGSERVMTEDEYARWKFRLEAEAEVRRRREQAQRMRGGLGSTTVMHFDSEGNELP